MKKYEKSKALSECSYNSVLSRIDVIFRPSHVDLFVDLQNLYLVLTIFPPIANPNIVIYSHYSPTILPIIKTFEN